VSRLLSLGLVPDIVCDFLLCSPVDVVQDQELVDLRHVKHEKWINSDAGLISLLIHFHLSFSKSGLLQGCRNITEVLTLHSVSYNVNLKQLDVVVAPYTTLPAMPNALHCDRAVDNE
jgi:hypothetical protein